MTALQAIALYTGLNLALLIYLGTNISRHRRRAKVSLGVGADSGLEQAVRAHGNGVENVPIALLAMTILASLGTGTLVLHGLGIALTLGRGLHAYGLLSERGPSFGRLAGISLTWLMMLASALLLLAKALS